MGNNYDLLLEKINEFTRKFYLNKLLRGSIYAAASILALYLATFLLVYYAQPSIAAKTTLFFVFLLLALAAVGFWIVKPALSYFNIRKGITIEEAASLIGNHFFNVKDRLLNTLQLKSLADTQPQQSALILAGIDQKIAELKPIPFTNAVNLSENKKQIKFIAFPLGIILLIGIIAPAILREGTKSFIRYDEEVLPEAPFEFQLLNKSLRVTQGDDFTLNLKLEGDEFPQDIYVQDGANTYKLEKKNIANFVYTFQNIQSNKSLKFHGGGFSSNTYKLEVTPRPQLLGVNAKFIFPAYLNRKDEETASVGDLLLPEGTKIIWNIRTANTYQIDFVLQNKTHALVVDDEEASFSATIKKNSNYRIIPKNSFVSAKDSIGHQIAVIQDQFPSIDVKETPDSLSNKAIYFAGSIADDYGFSSLKFKYQIKENNKVLKSGANAISIKNNQTENTFFYLWDINSIKLNPGENIEYFFEVADNDGVNGAKIARSEIKTFKAPTAQEIAQQTEQGSKELRDKMESTIKLANTIEKESKKLSQSLIDKKQLTFEDKKQIEQLLDKQKQLEKSVDDIKKLNEKNNFNKEENNLLNQELKEKQKQINDLFNNVLSDKTKELLDKLQKLMEQNSKDMMRNELNNMQMDNKSLKNELDRILELYKQLDFDQQLQNKIDRMKDLAEKQKDLAKQAQDPKSDANDLKEKQEKLNEEFKDLKDEMKKLEQKDQQLERPNNFKAPEKDANQVQQKQNQSKEQLSKKDKKGASENQQKAGEQMQQMAEQMEQDQQEGEAEDNKVNAKDLRKLLENLLTTSFEQEKVLMAFRNLNTTDPGYVAMAQQQNVIKENMKTIADSLYSLSKRAPQIESMVNTEVDKINVNIANSIAHLGERRTGEALRGQQFAMTSMNNLTLMLNESLENMQKKKGGGKGKGKQNMQDLQKMQEELNKNMQNAKDKMEKQGNKGSVPKGQMSQEFGRMAQQQQMIREALQKLNQEENKDGGEMGKKLDQMVQEMKKTENDLVNKRLTEETLKRQKDLTVKLLEAQKSQREQDQDSKRESNAAKQFPPSYLQMLEKHKKDYKSQSEMIQQLPPNLNYYYKQKVAEYFKLLNSPNR